MIENDKEIQMINEKMVKLYSKIFKLKHKLNLCSKDCPCDEKEIKEINVREKTA